jgi:FkbM family methyltransferase
MRSRVQHLRLRLLIALTRVLTRVLAVLGLRESVVRWRMARARRKRAAAEARGDFGRSRPALHRMDVKLDEIIDRDAGFFVEAGAYDGYTQSNTYWLERGRGWRGLLVEPMPELAEQARLSRPDATVVQCALAPPESAEGKIRMRFGGLMSGVARLSDEQWAKLGTAMGWHDPYELDVDTRTLSSLLDQIDAPEVDLISLDVEGFESAVLAGLDLDRHAPRYLLVEAHEPERDLPPIYEVLGSRYALEMWLSPIDLLLVREDVAQAGPAEHGREQRER